jgi:hypothetical protein
MWNDQSPLGCSQFGAMCKLSLEVPFLLKNVLTLWQKFPEIITLTTVAIAAAKPGLPDFPGYNIPKRGEIGIPNGCKVCQTVK